MANNSRLNPMIIDTTGSLIGVNSKVTINNIIVTASNATWALILQDGAGNVVYSISNIAGQGGGFAMPFTCTGLNATTVTAVTAYIYTVPS